MAGIPAGIMEVRLAISATDSLQLDDCAKWHKIKRLHLPMLSESEQDQVS